MSPISAFLFAFLLGAVSGQRITTIQLDGVSYFISRMNPYSPELNYFLAYQYCRSIGLQLASFETREKADSLMQYLKNAGYHKYDFWTSGNRLGTDMLIWMSTGLPFNATFDYMRKAPGEESLPVARQLGAVEQRKDSGAANGCVTLKAPDLIWDTDDCTNIKDFICEQTRCYYYNYGSIPVSSAQGINKIKYTSTTTTTTTSSSTPQPTYETTNPSQTTEPVLSSSTSDPVSGPESGRSEAEMSGTHESVDSTTPSNEGDQGYTGENNETVPSTQEPEPEVKARTISRTNTPEPSSNNTEVPWSWARNIMLEKPVLRKSASL